VNSKVCALKERNILRENHANARKISDRAAVLGDEWRSAPGISSQNRENILTEKAALRWHESGFRKSTMERLFGAKIFRAAVHARGEVGAVAGKLRSTLFAQTASLS
jgi:hypothetical protein